MKSPSERCLLLCACLVAASLLAAPPEPKKAEAAKIIKQNESSAVGSLRSLNTAEYAYAKTYPEAGFACKLKVFNPPRKGKEPSAKAADLIDPSLTSGTKNGYKFVLTCTEKSKPQKTYRIAAVPVEVGVSGKRAFCTDQTAKIRAVDDGSAASCFAKGKNL